MTKIDQMRKKPNWGRNYGRLYEEAANIYRIQVQCRQSKRFAIMKQYDLPDISLRGFINEQISREIIRNYYGATIGYGGYYSLTAAKELTEQQSKWRRNKKTGFYNWLQVIAQSSSYPDGLELFSKGTYLVSEPETWVQGSRRTHADYMDISKDIGMNSITIHDSMGLSRLINPLVQAN